MLDVVVVGGGPAGVAAAVRAAEAGRRVALVDDNPALGGQIWRHGGRAVPAGARPWLARLHAAGAEVLAGTAVVDAGGPGVLYTETGELRTRRLVLATGAQELFLPFPGWTLPNVFGAGGLQALVKGGLPVAGKRIAVAGSGPLLAVAAAEARRRGARVVALAEQAPPGRLVRFAAALARHPGKLVQLAGLAASLSGVPRRFSTWPVQARGESGVESLVLRSADGRERTVPVDAVACGFGLVADTRLAGLLGCACAHGRVLVDEAQRTSVEGVYAAGETTGVGGVDAALVEGQVAGLAAAGEDRLAAALAWRRRRHDRFAAALAKAFALRGELREALHDDTVVCRCEGATWGDVRLATSFREAKLRSRCGMGPCQGRVCAPALRFLRGFGSEGVRPPLFPVPMSFYSENTRRTT